jgi:hypothetical protein
MFPEARVDWQLNKVWIKDVFHVPGSKSILENGQNLDKGLCSMFLTGRNPFPSTSKTARLSVT